MARRTETEMAILRYSTKDWTKIEEKLLHCTFCGQRLRDPKLLPCLHRGCRACLEIKISTCVGGRIICPKCMYTNRIPDDGIDGFETDVIVKHVNQIEEIRLNLRRRRDCCVCGRNRACRAYCFICEGYLCDNCHKIHRENIVYQEHRLALTTANDFVKGDIDTIFSKMVLKCEEHPQNKASQCCVDCGSKMICYKCAAEEHRNHVIEGISDKAVTSKEDLSRSIGTLTERVHDVKYKQERIDDIKATLGTIVNKKSQNLRTAYEHEKSKISTTENFVAGEYEDRSSNLKNDLKVDIESLQISMREEIQMVEEKYMKLIREKMKWAKDVDEKLKKRLKWEMDKFKDTKETLKKNFTELMIEVGKDGHERRAKLYEMTAHFDQVIQRQENLTALASIVIATGSDGIAIKVIPTIFSAVEKLTEDVSINFPSLESLSEFPPYYLPEVNLAFDEKEEEECGDGCRKGILSTDSEISPEVTEL